MKFSCTQENFSNALRLVHHIANQNVNLPILNHVLIKASKAGLILQTTDLEIGASVQMRAKIEQEGSYTVPARLLTSYIDLLTHDRVDVELTNGGLRLSAGKNTTEIKGQSAEDFPLIPDVPRDKSLTLANSDLHTVFAQTVLATSMDESRPEINGVFFAPEAQQLTCAATDSHRLAERSVPISSTKGELPSVIIPVRTVQEVLKVIENKGEEKVSIFLSENQILFESGDLQLFSRLVDAKFIDYKHVIPKEFKTQVWISSDALLKAVKITSLFTRVGIHDVHLTIQPKQGVVLVRTENTQVGQNTSAIEVSKIEGEENNIVFNYRYLLDGLSVARSEEMILKIVDPASAALLQGVNTEKFQYVLMPIKQ